MNKQSKPTGKKRASTTVESHIKDARDQPLGYEGKKLFEWCEQNFEIRGVEPLLHELCVLADRLSEIRRELKKALDPRLMSAEVKFASQYTKCWKLLGLADDPKKSGRLSRPAGIAQPQQPLRVSTLGRRG